MTKSQMNLLTYSIRSVNPAVVMSGCSLFVYLRSAYIRYSINPNLPPPQKKDKAHNYVSVARAV